MPKEATESALLTVANDRVAALARCFGVGSRVLPADVSEKCGAERPSSICRCMAPKTQGVDAVRAATVPAGLGCGGCVCEGVFLVQTVRRGGACVGWIEFGPFRTETGRANVRSGCEYLRGSRRLPVAMPVLDAGTVAAVEVILGHIAEVVLAGCEREAAGTPPVVAWAKQYMEHNAAEPLSVARLALTAGLSSDHFGRVFRTATGVTVTDFLNRLRVQRACELLVGTGRRVSDIAYECGFESVPHFNRVFRRLTGLPPTRMRRRGYSGWRFEATEGATMLSGTETRTV